jgi:hypothetical protein
VGTLKPGRRRRRLETRPTPRPLAYRGPRATCPAGCRWTCCSPRAPGRWTVRGLAAHAPRTGQTPASRSFRNHHREPASCRTEVKDVVPRFVTLAGASSTARAAMLTPFERRIGNSNGLLAPPPREHPQYPPPSVTPCPQRVWRLPAPRPCPHWELSQPHPHASGWRDLGRPPTSGANHHYSLYGIATHPPVPGDHYGDWQAGTLCERLCRGG